MTKEKKAFINLVLTSNTLLWIGSVNLEGECFTVYTMQQYNVSWRWFLSPFKERQNWGLGEWMTCATVEWSESTRPEVRQMGSGYEQTIYHVFVCTELGIYALETPVSL